MKEHEAAQCELDNQIRQRKCDLFDVIWYNLASPLNIPAQNSLDRKREEHAALYCVIAIGCQP